MEMADNPKLDMASSSAASGLEENMATTQKISILDHINGFQSTKEKPDSFVIDMESFSPRCSDKDINPNSRITLQRSLSRKGFQRGGEKKINSNPNLSAADRESVSAISSPRGSSPPEKAATMAVGTTDLSGTPQVHHQITITTGNINANTEGRCPTRRNSFKRSAPSWVLDPKRVLFFFATLSSMGTMLLIYFTLSVGKLNADDSSLG